MKNTKKKRESEQEILAMNISGNALHISEVKSGRGGYFCCGCGNELVAHKGEFMKHHFKHLATNISRNIRKCIHSSNEYRERIAKSILNRLKYVKVPKLYKYPPSGENGAPNLLQGGKIIEAAYTKSELTFYEDEFGSIKYGSNPEIQERYLQLRPDVTFFDKNDKPILFIEFVFTHKVNDEKKIKLQRIGIDTIQIKLPKTTIEDIESTIRSTKNTYWVYNEIESNTNYVRVPSGNTEEVFPIDENQRRIFEKSFTCKSSELNELIRKIERHLQSEQYKTTKRNFDSEISRATKNTEILRNDSRKIERGLEEEISREVEPKERFIEERRSELEGRYLKKRDSIITEESDFERKEAESIRNKKIKEDLEESINAKNNFINEVERDFKENAENLKREFDNKRTSLEKLYRVFEAEEFKIIKDTTISIKQTRERVNAQAESNKRDLKEEIRRIEQQIREEESFIEELRREEEVIYIKAREEFNRRVEASSSKLPQELRNLLDSKRLLGDFEDLKCLERRYKIARQVCQKYTS